VTDCAAKRLLLIAFHFPPLQGSTGLHRSLAFARYLARHGWEVTVLTATQGAYPETSPENLALVPGHVRVVRALALDAQRHLSVFGRYPASLAVPDRWRSWVYSGVRAGRRVLRDWQPHAIFSTFPIPSAHEIALRLCESNSLPWIADFRDPMGQQGYPKDERVRRALWDLERRVLRRCSGVTVTTEGTAALYRDRYPDFPADRVRVIPNGFDEQAFEQLPPAMPRSQRRAGPVRFLHSGILYPYERNPDWFFRALAELRAEGRLSPETASFDLRGSAHDERYAPKLAELGLTDMVRLLPGVPYRDALREMTEADVLMLFQADNCNLQIPAKLYEYLYVGRPVMGLTDPAGDTGRLLAELGIDAVARLDDVAAIKALVLRCVQQASAGTGYAPTRESIMRFSRAGMTGLLARFLDELVVGARCADESSSGR